jgi:hypothetical protein
MTQPSQRLMERAHKIARRLDPEDGNALGDCPPKPKGMRWRTYRGLEAEFEYCATMALARIMRRLNRAA